MPHLFPLEARGIVHGELIRRDAHVERIELCPTLSKFLPLLGVAIVRENLEPRQEALQLGLPVDDARRGYNDQVRPIYSLETSALPGMERIDKLEVRSVLCALYVTCDSRE